MSDTVHAGANAERYHDAEECASTHDYTREYVEEITVEEAVERGLSPCAVCRPPPPEGNAMEHLEMVLSHAEAAAEAFEDGSKGESAAENAVAWTRKAVEVVEGSR